jgi:hypothetical protein
MKLIDDFLVVLVKTTASDDAKQYFMMYSIVYDMTEGIVMRKVGNVFSHDFGLNDWLVGSFDVVDVTSNLTEIFFTDAFSGFKAISLSKTPFAITAFKTTPLNALL